jgi:hypothetical protein
MDAASLGGSIVLAESRAPNEAISWVPGVTTTEPVHVMIPVARPRERF